MRFSSTPRFLIAFAAASLAVAMPAHAEDPQYLPQDPSVQAAPDSKTTPGSAEDVGKAIDKALEAISKPGTGPLSFDDGKLDRLFAELKRTRNPDVAQVLAEQVRAEFRFTRSATIDMLINHADAAMQAKKYPAALDYLDQAIVLDPTYVEGWNRRATLHYVMGNPKKSMADIAEVLARDPRHLGALAGMAGILSESGRKAKALKVWQHYLDLYPADRSVQKVFSDLSEEVAGQKT